MTTSASLDPTAIAEIATATRAVLGVYEAVAVVRQGARTGVSAPAAAGTDASHHVLNEVDKPSSDIDGGELRIPAGAPTTLQAALRQAAELSPEKGTVFVARDGAAALQTYPELLAEAERVLAGLRATGLRPGDSALFQFDDNRGYITAFWACVLGGFVPTPVTVATTYGSLNATNRRLHNAWILLERPVLLTDRATAPGLAEIRKLWGEPDVRLLTVENLAQHAPDADWYPTTHDSPVFNLLTSGSTGIPKCVQHTNATVVARTWAVAQARGYSADDVTVNWMPLDHVAIVMYNVRDVFLRCQHVNARIDHFLADPIAWLDWLSEYRATNTWAPNFAFAMVNERAAEIAGRRWDLSWLRAITNAAEPVIATTSRRFLELLAPHGLPADAMWPGWGMSETCSVVTYACQHRDDLAAATVAVAQSSLSGDIRHVDADDRDAVIFSSVGPPVPGMSMRIVDGDGTVLPEDRMGELLVRGSALMRGYHSNAEANRESYDPEGWFRTGDLAFVHCGSVVIAGRKKDQIVVRGLNYIAHEIESVVEQVDGVRVTYAAAAGVREPGKGSDQLVIFFVPLQWDADALARTVGTVRATLVREVGLAPDLVVPVTEAEFPKTGSGKIQRSALVTELRAGRFADRIAGDDEPERPATWFFRRQWSPLPEVVCEAGDRGPVLVFAEDDQLAWTGLDGSVIVVSRGEGFAEERLGRFRVSPGDAEDVRCVLTNVTDQHGPLSTVVFAWSLLADAEPADTASRLDATTEQLTSLVRALADGEFGRPLLLVLTAGSVHVRGGDRVDLGTCALPGLVRTAVTEALLPTVRQLDLPGDRSCWADAVRTELADRAHSGVVAFRAGQRWQPRLRPVPGDGTEVRPPVVAGGLYLITGGLGGIAHDLAGYLLGAYGARLLLIGRSPAVGDRADLLAELADLGEVRYCPLDVADKEALSATVAAAEQRWGRTLDGVLHLAGEDPTPQWKNLERHTLDREERSTFTEFYRAKVAGTLAIGTLLESRPGTSVVLFGSVNGEFGAHSFGAYAAANTFLVGFADHWHYERGRDVRCLAWSMWTGVGMNRTQPTAPVEHRGFRPIDPADGLLSYLAAISMPHHYILIGLELANPMILSELDADELSAREVLVAYTAEGADRATVQRALESTLRDCPIPVRLMEVPHIPTNADGTVDTAQLLLDTAPSRPRRKQYTAPDGDLEHLIADIWSEVLNRPLISRDDSFFDLGGSSVRATRLLAAINNKLAVRIGIQELYENPTIAGLAASILAT